MALAFVNKEFEAVFQAPGQTSSTLLLTIHELDGATYTEISESPITVTRIRDGEFRFVFTFIREGIYIIRFGNSASAINVQSDRVGAIKLRTDNMPQG